MTRDEIKIITETLGFDLANSDTLSDYLDEVFYFVRNAINPPYVKAKLLSVTQGTATYSLDSDTLKIISLLHEDGQLFLTTKKALDAYTESWQSDTGTPIAFTQDIEDAREFLIYPIPDTTTASITPSHGEPLGEDYPNDAIVMIYVDDRKSDIPSVYALPFAFASLSAEFINPSDHTDAEFSSLCREISTLFANILGVS